MKYKEWLMHFNPNHDPDNGQFTDKKGYAGRNKIANTKSKKVPKDVTDKLQDKRMEEAWGSTFKKLKNNSTDKKKNGLTDKQKKALTIATVGAIAAVGVTAGIVIAHRLHATEKIKELLGSGVKDVNRYKDVMTEAIDDETEILRSGALIHRMQFGAGIDVTTRDDITMAVYKPRDKGVYMALLKDYANSGGEKHAAVYETIRDIRMPTEKKAREIFDKLWNDDPHYQNALKRTIREFIRDTVPHLSGASDDFIDQYISPTAFGKNSNDNFYKGIWALVRRGEDSQIFIDAMKKEGYDAIHDYHDIMDKLSEAPVILFDPKSDMVKKGEEIVTKQSTINTLKGLLKAGEKVLPTENPNLQPINTDGKLDITKLMNAIKSGLL